MPDSENPENPIHHQSIQSQRGWIYFVVGLLVALFIGGAVRVFFAPEQVGRWVEQALETQDSKLSVQFASAEVSLREGWLPRLGLVIRDVEIQAADPCVTGSKVQLDRLYLPVSLSHLVNKKLSFRRLNVQEMNVSIKEAVCSHLPEVPESTVAETPVDNRSRSNDSDPVEEAAGVAPKREVQWKRRLDRFDKFVNDRWPQEMTNAREWLDEIRVQRLNLQLSAGRTLSMKNLHLDLQKAGEPFVLKTVFELSDQLRWGQPLSPVHFRAEFTPELVRFESSASFKEGQIKNKGHLLLASHQYELASELKHLPATHLFEILRHLELTDQKILPKLAWFSCGARVSGRMDEWQESVLHINDCGLEGDIGQVTVQTVEMKPWSKVSDFQPFRVELSDVALEKVIHSLGRTGPSGILSDFGQLNGELEVQAPDVMKFKGGVDDLKAVFSSRGERGKQHVSSVKGELLLKDGRVSGLVDHIELNQGAFKGQLSFNLDKEFRQGLLQIQVDHLEFHPSIQRLMVGGHLAPLELYGQAKVEQGEIAHWRGDIGCNEVAGAGWMMQKVKLKSEFEEGVFSSRVSVAEAQVQPNHAYHELIRPLYLDQAQEDQVLKWKNISARLVLDEKGGQWEHLQSRAKDSRVLFASEGEWKFSGPVKGWVSVDFPVLKLLKWELSGKVSQPRLLPSARMLKQLAKRNPGLNKELQNLHKKAGFLSTSLSEEKMKEWKELGKKVIETAIKMIPEMQDKGRAPQSQGLSQESVQDEEGSFNAH